MFADRFDKAVHSFESLDKFLIECDHLNESYCEVTNCGATCFHLLMLNEILVFIFTMDFEHFWFMILNLLLLMLLLPSMQSIVDDSTLKTSAVL